MYLLQERQGDRRGYQHTHGVLFWWGLYMKVNKISAVAVRTRDGDYAKALYAITQQPCKERALRHRKGLTSLMDTWT